MADPLSRRPRTTHGPSHDALMLLCKPALSELHPGLRAALLLRCMVRTARQAVSGRVGECSVRVCECARVEGARVGREGCEASGRPEARARAPTDGSTGAGGMLRRSASQLWGEEFSVKR